MKKYTTIIAVILSLVFIFTGCANERVYITSSDVSDYKEWADAKYEMFETEYTSEINKDLAEEKEVFLKSFKEFCGFSLPDYFDFLKRKNEDENYFSAYIEDVEGQGIVHVSTTFSIKKNDALEMLEYLKKDTAWEARYSIGGPLAKTQKERELCNVFMKEVPTELPEGAPQPRGGFKQGVYLYFYYNENQENYLLKILAELLCDQTTSKS
ncbi:MAG: hypothetical protein IJO49_03610 [Clostridia bacterium]|nr:hypothetical protein [Clostridia bacterium]